MRTPVHVVLAVLLALAACRKDEAPAAKGESPSTAPVWPDARTLGVGLGTAAGVPLVVELHYRPPAAAAGTARLELVAIRTGGTNLLWSASVTPEQRDALWGAKWAMAFEPEPGDRFAISADGGATWRPVFRFAADWIFCPHLRVPKSGEALDWMQAPSLQTWAAGVFQTAVWACDDAGARCKRRALGKLAAHHTEAGEDPLPLAQFDELPRAMDVAEKVKPDRAMAVALVDAAVGFQRGLNQPQLERLGRIAARAIGPGGPLSEEERRTLKLRITLAGQEAKQLPAGQLSPRVSIASLAAALDEMPSTVGGK